MRFLLISSSFFLFAGLLISETPDAGKKAFNSICSRCHGADGNGGEMGPSILSRLHRRNDQQLTSLIHTGLPARGMPMTVIGDAELTQLVAYLRSIQRENPLVRCRVDLAPHGALQGLVLGEGFDDLQLRTADNRVHLLRRSGDRYREVTSEVDWPTYNGETGGNRFTALTQIDKNNIGQLAPKWIFTVPNAGGLEVTPVVVGGIMYVTAASQVFALDGGTGRQIWRFEAPRQADQTTGGGANRGVGVADDRVFVETDRAHVIALNRFTGELLWDSEIADWRQNYFATSAPLPAGNLVITGVGGGEHGANGVVAAFDQQTGKEVWRFHTVPKAGEPGYESWRGREPNHGGAPTWFTGSYDPELDTIYWPTGNPSEEYNGDFRQGDNLYSDCILALDRKTGEMKWHYQFTPHDLWDWDATETSIVVNAKWEGRERKLLLHADRNGFFYVFDRVAGKLLLATPFIRNLTWASKIGADGRPVKLPNQFPTTEGTKVCPSQDGATNWFSPSFNPSTGLLYLQTFEKCSIYKKTDGGVWEAGRTFLGGSQNTSPDPKPEKVLKALNIRTGEVAWELPQPGPAQAWGGTLATAAGLVIFGAETGELMAADAVSGKPLWSFPTNEVWRASPMSYSFDGKQHIAVAAGSSILAFAIADKAVALSEVRNTKSCGE